MKKKKLNIKNVHIKKRVEEIPDVKKDIFDELIKESTKHEPFDKKKVR